LGRRVRLARTDLNPQSKLGADTRTKFAVAKEAGLSRRQTVTALRVASRPARLTQVISSDARNHRPEWRGNARSHDAPAEGVKANLGN